MPVLVLLHLLTPHEDVGDKTAKNWVGTILS